MIYTHLATYSTPSRTRHQNMHLRQSRRSKGRPTRLHYLHAMYASSANVIDGAISGPSVFWRYRIRLVNGRTHVDLLDRQCSAKEDARLQRQFIKEVMSRLRQEQSGGIHPFPTLTDGEFYLRRRIGGMATTHPTCRRAVSLGVLDIRFVSQLQSWNLMLLCP